MYTTEVDWTLVRVNKTQNPPGWVFKKPKFFEPWLGSGLGYWVKVRFRTWVRVRLGLGLSQPR